MFWFSVRWSIYCTISFFVALGIAVETTRFFAVVVVITYLVYMIFDTVKNSLDAGGDDFDYKQNLIKSAIANTPDYIWFLVSLAVGIFVGVSR